MQIEDKRHIVYNGEQFTFLLSGDWDGCSQIVICIYNNNNGTKHYYVKEADANYPDAGLLYKSEDEEYTIACFLSEQFTKALQPAKYYIEAKAVIAGVFTPILKKTTELFIVKKSEV